jgi:sugar lactone lactonase YvrE
VTFSTITPGPVYQVPAAVLGDPARSDAEIAAEVQIVGQKPTSDGIAVAGDVVYITDVETNAVIALQNGRLRTVRTDPRLVWPDGIAIAPDGTLLVTINQLNRAAPFSGGRSRAEPPSLLVRRRDEP